MRDEERYVLAAIGPETGRSPVRRVANTIAGCLGAKVREVCLGPGPWSAEEVRFDAIAAARNPQRVRGHEIEALTELVESDRAILAVFPSSELGGAALAVASRVTKPILLIPPGIGPWGAPRRVLVPLNGTLPNAGAAASALACLGVRDATTTVVHVFDEDTVPSFWDNPHHEYEAWTKEFGLRYADAIGGPLVLRAGEVGEQLADMVTSGAYDLAVIVWSQRRGKGHALVLRDLLVKCPVPILLVPTRFVARAPRWFHLSDAPAA